MFPNTRTLSDYLNPTIEDSALFSQAVQKSLDTFLASYSTKTAPVLRPLHALIPASQLLTFTPIVMDKSKAYSPLPSTGLLYDNTINEASKSQQLGIQQRLIDRRKKLAQDLDDILEQIRQKPGFDNFLLP